MRATTTPHPALPIADNVVAATAPQTKAAINRGIGSRS